MVFMSRFTPFTTKCFEKPIPKELVRCSLRAWIARIVKSTVSVRLHLQQLFVFYKTPHSGYVASWSAEFTRHQAPAQLYRIVTAKFRRSLLRFKSHVKPLFVPPPPTTNQLTTPERIISVCGETNGCRPSVSENLSILFFVTKIKIIGEVLTYF